VVLDRRWGRRDEQLLGDIRALWKQSLILNRPGRTRDQIGADVASGLADLEATARWSLPTRISSLGWRPVRRCERSRDRHSTASLSR
jgi:hypothetical protein